MRRSSNAAHYLVFHPERARTPLRVSARALVDGALDRRWRGTIWVDRPPNNEDPFVLGPTWVYSYCHATQLRREPTPRAAFLQEGSCLIFCSGDWADRGFLLVDTVFWIAGAYAWQTASQPPTRYASDAAEQSNLWKFHLRFGGLPGGHPGKFTFEAALHHAADGRFSYLPLDINRERVRISFKDLPTAVRDLVRSKLHMKRPAQLSPAQLEKTLQVLQRKTVIQVIGNIRPEDAVFARMRWQQGTGSGCSPKSLVRQGSRLC